jgi:urease accessory protein
MRAMTKLFSIPLLLSFAAPAFAHPGHDLHSAGFLAGVSHPLLGVDHLLAMLIVGVWAAQLGGKARWLVPASFIAVMAIGAGFAMNGIAPPQVEAGIAVSLLVLGLLATSALRVSLVPAMLLVGAFALFHGAAHGLELPTLAQPGMFALGFLMSTAALHAVGVALGSISLAKSPVVARISGAVAVVAGLVFAFA